MVDEVRRRRCAPVVTCVEEGEARLINPHREENLTSSLGRVRGRKFDCVRQSPGGRVAERVGAKAWK